MKGGPRGGVAVEVSVYLRGEVGKMAWWGGSDVPTRFVFVFQKFGWQDISQVIFTACAEPGTEKARGRQVLVHSLKSHSQIDSQTRNEMRTRPTCAR